MQALQVGTKVKQVTGDLIKGGFQTHEKSAKKLYKACNCFMMRIFTSSGYLADIITETFPSKLSQLRWILDCYRKYRDLWETSVHEPSHMVSLFLKLMRCYLRCNHAIDSCDGWMLEIQSAKLLPVWKIYGKSTYMQLKCEYMEQFYNDECCLLSTVKSCVQIVFA